MGAITYDGVVVEFDDRTLTHLQIVIVRRFTLGRSVLLSWLDAVHAGAGRASMWLTPSAPLHFEFAGSRAAAVDPGWLALLTERAASGTGLVVCDERGDLVRSIDRRRLVAVP